jgi:hypothetical protein
MTRECQEGPVKAPWSVVKARASVEESNKPPDPFDRLAMVCHVEADPTLRPARQRQLPSTRHAVRIYFCK